MNTLSLNLARQFVSLRETLEPLGFRISVIYTSALFGVELSAPMDYVGTTMFGCNPRNISQILSSLAEISVDVIKYISLKNFQ